MLLIKIVVNLLKFIWKCCKFFINCKVCSSLSIPYWLITRATVIIMGNIVCCFEKPTTNDNIPPAQGVTRQRFGSGPFDRLQNERRDGSEGSGGLAAGRLHQNEAQMRNSSTAKKASQKRKGDGDRLESQFGNENTSSLTNPNKAKNAKRQREQTESNALNPSLKPQKRPTSRLAERENLTKFTLLHLGGRHLSDKGSNATFIQPNAQSKTHLNRTSETNKKKSNHSKLPNHDAQLLKVRQVDAQVPSPTKIFDLKEYNITSEENEVKNIKSRSSTYDNVRSDQYLPSTSTSPPGLDCSASPKKVAIKPPPTMISCSSRVKQPELQRNEKTANPTLNLGWSKSSNGHLTSCQHTSSFSKDIVIDIQSDLFSVSNSSPANNSYTPAYGASWDGTARVLSGAIANQNKMNEISDFGHILQRHYSQITKPPINDVDPLDLNRKKDFLRAFPVEGPGCVAEKKVYPTVPTRSSSKHAVKVVRSKMAHPVESLPEDLIQFGPKEREYKETHFLSDNYQENNRVWNSEEKDSSPSDKVDEMGYRKNSEVNPDSRNGRDFSNQIPQNLDMLKKQSSLEIKRNYEESCSKDTESLLSSRPGLNFAFELRANSETHKPSHEDLGAVDCPLPKHATEERSKKGEDVHTMIVDLTDQMDAAVHDINPYPSTVNTLLIEECFKKVVDTAQENLHSKGLSNERLDQHEATSAKQLGSDSSFYNEGITATQHLIGEDAATYKQKPQNFASGVGRVDDVEERSQEKQALLDVKINTAEQFDFQNLNVSKSAMETSEDIPRNDILENDEAKPLRADQHYGEWQACNSNGEFSEDVVMKCSSIPQHSAPNQVDNEDTDTWDEQKCMSFSSSLINNGQGSSWSGQMREDLTSSPSIESIYRFDAIPQGYQNSSFSIDSNANYTYQNEHDLRNIDATKLPHHQYLDGEQSDWLTLTSTSLTHVGDVQLSTNFDTLNTSESLSMNLQELGMHPQPDCDLREIGEGAGKGKFPIESNRSSSNYDIKPTVEPPFKATEEIIVLSPKSAHTEEAILEAETPKTGRPPKDSQAQALSKSDTDKDNLTELQKQIIQGLEQIREKAKPFETAIENFTELEDSNKHYFIEESLRRLVDKLDDLYDDIGDDDMLRLKRKEVYRYIFPLFDKLDNKVQFNRNEMERNQKE